MSLMNAQHEANASQPHARRWSMAWRLILFYATSNLVMLLLAAAYLHWSLAADLERDENAFLANKIQDCRRLLQDRPNDRALLANEVQTEAASSQFIKYFVRLMDDQDQTVIETPGMTAILPPRAFPKAIDVSQVPSQGVVWMPTAGTSYILMSAWAQVNAPGTIQRTIQVAIDVTTDESLIASYRLKLVVVVALGMLFAGVAGIFVARRGLRPLREIAQITERVTATQLQERILADGWPEELASLARQITVSSLATGPRSGMLVHTLSNSVALTCQVVRYAAIVDLPGASGVYSCGDPPAAFPTGESMGIGSLGNLTTTKSKSRIWN